MGSGPTSEADLGRVAVAKPRQPRASTSTAPPPLANASESGDEGCQTSPGVTVKDKPEQVSNISWNCVNDQVTPECQASPGTGHVRFSRSERRFGSIGKESPTSDPHRSLRRASLLQADDVVLPTRAARRYRTNVSRTRGGASRRARSGPGSRDRSAQESAPHEPF